MTHLMNAWTQRVRFLTVVTFISILLLALAAERADAVYYGLPTVTAFQANTHELLTYVSPEYSGGEKGVLYGSKAGIAEGTSPSVTGFGGYGYTVAFHAYGSAALWIYQSQYGTASPTGWGMEKRNRGIW
jgi:hypothetical protein